MSGERSAGWRLALRMLAAGSLAALGLACLGWGLWPVQRALRQIQVIIPPQPAGRATNQSAMSAGAGSDEIAGAYTITLDAPKWVRAGDTELVRLNLKSTVDRLSPRAQIHGDSSPSPQPSRIASAGPTYVLEARLEIEGIRIQPPGEVDSPWRPEASPNFFWEMQGREAGTSGGTAWLFVLDPDRAPTSSGRTAVSAQPLHVETRTLMGMDGASARIAGALALVLGLVCGLSRAEQSQRSAE